MCVCVWVCLGYHSVSFKKSLNPINKSLQSPSLFLFCQWSDPGLKEIGGTKLVRVRKDPYQTAERLVIDTFYFTYIYIYVLCMCTQFILAANNS